MVREHYVNIELPIPWYGRTNLAPTAVQLWLQRYEEVQLYGPTTKFSSIRG
eukprot:SAG31_NODE_5045_length_2778_cov_22.202688_2_plen_51_part_00